MDFCTKSCCRTGDFSTAEYVYSADYCPNPPSHPMPEFVGPTSNSYVSQRLRLHYVDWGNASAPPLLLVHGGRDHCRSWDWVARRLSDQYHIIALDLRGHGDSAWA